MTDGPLDLLVLGAHPDDLEIACGGTVLAVTARGGRAVGVDLTAGERATYGDADTRRREAAQAARVLGLQERENLGLPDGALRPDDHARRLVVEALRRHRPRIVLAPHPEDHHPDHAAAGRLAADACFFADVGGFPAAGERHRVELLLFYMMHYRFRPEVVVDVSPYYERKLEALRAFRSQLHDPDRPDRPTNVAAPDFLPRLEARHRFFGEAIGCTYGEPFAARRPLGVADPRSLR